MGFYRVELRRDESAVLWVEADDPADAEDAAEELSASANWEPWGEDYEVEDVHHTNHVPAGERYWTGGAEGHWETAG